MAAVDAGRIIILPKGEYSPIVSYEVLDLVRHGGSSWLCKNPCIGIEPSEGNYWTLFGSAAPIATEEIAGLVKPDGETITIDPDGTIHGASTVDIDGETIVENEDGQLSVPTATNSTLGVVKGEYEGYLGTKNLANNITNGRIGAKGEVIYSDVYLANNAYIEVKPNTQYTFSYITSSGSVLYISEFEKNDYLTERANLIVQSFESSVVSYTFQTGANTHFIGFALGKNGTIKVSKRDFTNIQIEEGGSATDYIQGIPSPQEMLESKANRTMLADDYEKTRSVNEGNIVADEQGLYKAIRNVPAGTSTTDATYFERTSVANEISKINSNFSDILSFDITPKVDGIQFNARRWGKVVTIAITGTWTTTEEYTTIGLMPNDIKPSIFTVFTSTEDIGKNWVYLNVNSSAIYARYPYSSNKGFYVSFIMA